MVNLDLATPGGMLAAGCAPLELTAGAREATRRSSSAVGAAEELAVADWSADESPQKAPRDELGSADNSHEQTRTSTHGWVRHATSVIALFLLCAVGAVSLHHTPALEFPSAPTGAWLAQAAPGHSLCTSPEGKTSTPAEPTLVLTDVSKTNEPPKGPLSQQGTGTAPPAEGSDGKGGASQHSAQPVSGIAPDGRIILNVAGVSELVRLKGIGKKRAIAILVLRKRLGGFKRLTDLLRVRGIGVATFRKLKPHLVLNPPQQPPNPSSADPPKARQEAVG